MRALRVRMAHVPDVRMIRGETGFGASFDRKEAGDLRQNYGFEKRKREEAKKKKREEKRNKRLNESAATVPSSPLPPAPASS